MAPTDSSKIEDFAEELGRLLGSAEAKARGWLGQREQIAKPLKGSATPRPSCSVISGTRPGAHCAVGDRR